MTETLVTTVRISRSTSDKLTEARAIMKQSVDEKAAKLAADDPRIVYNRTIRMDEILNQALDLWLDKERPAQWNWPLEQESKQ